MSEREIIIERVVNGRYVKVTAVDVATGREVSVVGDVMAPSDGMDALAMRKLERQLKIENLM